MKFTWGKNTNTFAVLWLLVIVAFMMPDIVSAAGAYGPSSNLQNDLVKSARDWWKLVANLAVIFGIVAAIVLYFFYPKYLGVAVVIAIIGGFGESVVDWVLTIGGGAEHVIKAN